MQPDTQAWSQAAADGRALYELADYRGAVVRWLDALVSLEETGSNARARADALYHIGVSYGRMGDIEDLVRSLERALEEHFAAPPPTLPSDHAFRARCLCALGEAYRSLGAYDFAADCFSAGADRALRAGDDELGVECLVGWGQTAEAVGDLISALNILNRAREIARGHAVLADIEARVDRDIHRMLLAAAEL